MTSKLHTMYIHTHTTRSWCTCSTISSYGFDTNSGEIQLKLRTFVLTPSTVLIFQRVGIFFGRQDKPNTIAVRGHVISHQHRFNNRGEVRPSSKLAQHWANAYFGYFFLWLNNRHCMEPWRRTHRKQSGISQTDWTLRSTEESSRISNWSSRCSRGSDMRLCMPSSQGLGSALRYVSLSSCLSKLRVLDYRFSLHSKSSSRNGHWKTWGGLFKISSSSWTIVGRRSKWQGPFCLTFIHFLM